MLILFLAFLFIALYSVARILLPEMNKPLLLKTILESNSLGFDQSNESDNRMTKLETLLTEKSKNIQLLQTELRISHVQIRDFDKVKVLLEEEIHHLREQNRIFRSELGIPPIASSVEHKENSII